MGTCGNAVQWEKCERATKQHFNLPQIMQSGGTPLEARFEQESRLRIQWKEK